MNSERNLQQAIVFDIETNGLTPDKIHCLSANKNGSIKSTVNYGDMRSFFSKAIVLVGHNIQRYDIPVVERLLGIKVGAFLIDTLALSWYLEPERPKHGLADWGEEFGIFKPKVDDWEGLSSEEYIHRCEEDVKINTRLWLRQQKALLKLYEGEEKALTFLDYLQFKMHCARLQEENRWKLDVVRCASVRDVLEVERNKKTEELKKAMPPVIKYAEKSKPAKPFKKNGQPSVAGQDWFNLLHTKGLAEDYDGTVQVVKEVNDPNPGSPIQIKDWLYGLGWQPATYVYKRDKETGDVRKIPQVQQEKSKGPGLCPSVKALFDKEPSLELLEGLTILTHRISILSGFLENVDSEGYVQAQVQGLTNTLRFKHKVVVNLPGVDKPYGSDIRGCLVADEGYELVGSDMSSLEDRTKQHYMWPYDPDYVREMQVDDFDPHIDLAVSAGGMTEKDASEYKANTSPNMKTLKVVRGVYKSANYACIYGTGAATLSRTAGISKDKAEGVIDAYWKRNWSVRKVAEAQLTKVCNGTRWLYNPVSKFWYSLRHEKDIFSTLNQGTGVYCFDTWIKHVNDEGPPIIGQMHDEGIWQIKLGRRDRCIAHIKSAMDKANKELGLNRELDCSVQFGLNYGEIH